MVTLRKVNTFAIYERSSKVLHIGSPDYSTREAITRFLRMGCFSEFLPRKWWNWVIPGSRLYAVAENSEGKEICMKEYRVVFPLSLILCFPSQKEEFEKAFDEFRELP